MMDKTINFELWPCAADRAGLWLISGGDAWRSSLAVPASTWVHAEAELELAGHGVGADRLALLHSTSWRDGADGVTLTYMAVVKCDGLVKAAWPFAQPIHPEVLDAVPAPIPHGAAEAPTPSDLHVLMHGLRHLRFLHMTDATAREALDANPPWPAHLELFEPALAQMYERPTAA